MSSGGQRLSFGLKHDPLVLVSTKPAPRTPVARRAAVTHVIERQVVADQLVGMDLDLDRAHVAAEHRDVGDARHGEQARRTVQSATVRNSISERVREVRPATSTRLVDDVSGVIIGGSTPCGSCWVAACQPLGDDLTVAIDVARWVEEDGDDREALDRARAQRLHAWHAVDGVLDRPGDEDLDLFGREADGLGLDADLGGANSGNTSYLARPSA